VLCTAGNADTGVSNALASGLASWLAGWQPADWIFHLFGLPKLRP